MSLRDMTAALADIVAAILLVSFASYIGLSILAIAGASLQRVGPVWIGLYGFLLLMSATKLYGAGVYNAVKSIGGQLLGADASDRQQASSKK